MEQKTNKVGIKGWLALLVLCIMFSGVLKDVEGPLKALDFSNLVGAWGKIGESGQNFIGKGGTGAREGMMQALSLIAIAAAVVVPIVLHKKKVKKLLARLEIENPDAAAALKKAK